jgi:beta-aspartyl-dipeptidase (metallo-type)
MECLLAKAKALRERVVTAYIYPGATRCPPSTLTGTLLRDLVLIEEAVGAGEIAVSDHRSSQPGFSASCSRSPPRPTAAAF